MGLYESSLEGDEPEELETVPWALSDLERLRRRDDFTGCPLPASNLLSASGFGQQRWLRRRCLARLPGLLSTRDAEIMIVYESAYDVEEKADGSPLTAADRHAHDLICDRLDAVDPGNSTGIGRIDRTGHRRAVGVGVLVVGRSSGWDEGIYPTKRRIHSQYCFD